MAYRVRAGETMAGGMRTDTRRSRTRGLFAASPKRRRTAGAATSGRTRRKRSSARGHLLDEALAEAGIDRTRVHVTNAVKHFKWRASGKRRLHERPNSAEVSPCRLWLELELRLVKPDIVVALGATAAQALLGPAFRVTKERGRVASSPLASHVVATVHPSSILRAPDDDARRAEMRLSFATFGPSRS